MAGLRSVGFGVLLVALAVQGITPDPDDLASSALPRLLAANLSAQCHRAISCSKPVVWPDEDPEKREQNPNDACAPVISGLRSSSQPESLRSRLFAGVSPSATPAVLLMGSPCAAIHPPFTLTRRARNHLLCRLIC